MVKANQIEEEEVALNPLTVVTDGEDVPAQTCIAVVEASYAKLLIMVEVRHDHSRE